MIVTEIFYGIKCNRCNEFYDDGEHSFFSDESSAEENATDDEWIVFNHKHYCPNCYEHNEETEDNIPIPEYPEHLKRLIRFLNHNIIGYNNSMKETSVKYIIEKGIYDRQKLDSFEEDYIKSLLGEKFESLEYKKDGRFTRTYCVITVNK